MKILLTVVRFDNLSGSVIHVAEMAKYFYDKGYHVSVVTLVKDEKIINMLSEDKFDVFFYKDLDLSVYYDLVIAYHFPILPSLIYDGLKFNKVINGILSVYANLEVPLFFSDKIDLFPVVSYECRDYLIDQHNIPSEKIVYLPNFITKDYMNLKKMVNSDIKKIAVISNHIPSEVLNLTKYLRDINIEFIGSGNNIKLVNEGFIKEFDLIISIGKTVQYCLGLGVPIYEYDFFGGCGYITLNNFEVEEYYNFSGRASGRKLLAEDLANEILTGYLNACNERINLREIALERFFIKDGLERLLSHIDEIPATDIVVTPDDRKLYLQNIELCAILGSSNSIYFVKNNSLFIKYLVKYLTALIPVKKWRKYIRNKILKKRGAL